MPITGLCRYEGEFEDGDMHGIGTLYKEGKTITGIWNMGKLSIDRSKTVEPEEPEEPENSDPPEETKIKEERKVNQKLEKEKVDHNKENLQHSEGEGELESDEEDLSDENQNQEEDLGRFEIAA